MSSASHLIFQTFFAIFVVLLSFILVRQNLASRNIALEQWFLFRGHAYPGGCKPLHTLQHWKFFKWKVFRPIYSHKVRGVL